MTAPPPPPAAALTATLLDVVEPLARARGLDVESLEVSRAGRRRRVVLLVDKDGGVSLDECAELSEQLSATLDGPAGADVLGEQPYVLEVGSPGVERPLQLPRHWRRNVGRLVRVVPATGGEAVVGRIRSADDAGAVLDVDGQELPLAYADVGRARVQVEFSRPGPDDPGDDLGDDSDDGEE